VGADPKELAMRKILGLITSLFLIAAPVAIAQQKGSHATPTYPSAGAASAHQGPGNFSQSSIQGCLMGSDTTSSYVLTDENTGEIYLLQGNDSLLKQNVGGNAWSRNAGR
jgi:hypothetical protein